ncbi:MAG TPA: hypothetical protein VGO67_16035 [Verrucomicrobiae bacterium]|jgi:hypothetical protein
MAKIPKLPLPKPGQISLKQDESTTIPAIFANSYNVLFEKGIVRVNFACLSAGQLLKGATVFLPNDLILSNKDETVDYFNKMQDVKPDEPTPFFSEKFDVFYGQIFAFSRSGQMSETNPLFVRLHLLATATASAPCVATVSINMPIEAQLGIVKAIYIDDWAQQKAS